MINYDKLSFHRIAAKSPDPELSDNGTFLSIIHKNLQDNTMMENTSLYHFTDNPVTINISLTNNIPGNFS